MPAEALDLSRLPGAKGTAAEAVGCRGTGPLPYGEYFRFLKRFSRTEEQLRAVPLSTGPRFTLD